MQLAFRVDLDTKDDPTILHTLYGFRIGDKFIVKAYAHHDDPREHEVVAILSQYVPNIKIPCVRDQDQYLIADGLVISVDKVTRVEKD